MSLFVFEAVLAALAQFQGLHHEYGFDEWLFC